PDDPLQPLADPRARRDRAGRGRRVRARRGRDRASHQGRGDHMTAASLPVTAVRGMVATWPGRILAIVLAAVVVGGAVTIFRGNTGTPAVTYRTAEAARASLAQTVAISDRQSVG